MNFFIPTAPAAERLAIERLVEQCLAARGENCGAWESEINPESFRDVARLSLARLFRSYGLTPDEIQLVEESIKK